MVSLRARPPNVATAYQGKMRRNLVAYRNNLVNVFWCAISVISNTLSLILSIGITVKVVMAQLPRLSHLAPREHFPK